jgi:hypothetical protein
LQRIEEAHSVFGAGETMKVAGQLPEWESGLRERHLSENGVMRKMVKPKNYSVLMGPFDMFQPDQFDGRFPARATAKRRNIKSAAISMDTMKSVESGRRGSIVSGPENGTYTFAEFLVTVDRPS